MLLRLLSRNYQITSTMVIPYNWGWHFPARINPTRLLIASDLLAKGPQQFTPGSDFSGGVSLIAQV